MEDRVGVEVRNAPFANEVPACSVVRLGPCTGVHEGSATEPVSWIGYGCRPAPPIGTAHLNVSTPPIPPGS